MKTSKEILDELFKSLYIILQDYKRRRPYDHSQDAARYLTGGLVNYPGSMQYLKDIDGIPDYKELDLILKESKIEKPKSQNDPPDPI